MLGGQGFTTNKIFSLLVAWPDEPLDCSCQGKAYCEPENWNTLVPVRESHDCKILLLLYMGFCCQINLRPSALKHATNVVFLVLRHSLPLQQGSFLELWWVPYAQISNSLSPWASLLSLSSPQCGEAQPPSYCSCLLSVLSIKTRKSHHCHPLGQITSTGSFPGSLQECRQHCALRLTLCFFVFVLFSSPNIFYFSLWSFSYFWPEGVQALLCLPGMWSILTSCLLLWFWLLSTPLLCTTMATEPTDCTGGAFPRPFFPYMGTQNHIMRDVFFVNTYFFAQAMRGLLS